VSGTHVVAWTFVPLAQTSPRIPRDLKFGTLTSYKSSPGITRAFCGDCGATVFYSCDDLDRADDEHIVDLSVGILRAPEGPTAENWLTWRTVTLGWLNNGKRYDPVFVESLAEALSAWGRDKYGQSSSFDFHEDSLAFGFI
jgi:hypothetical protein